MPNVRRQTVYTSGGPQALEVVGSDGRTCLLTKQQIQAFYQTTSGSAAERKAQVIAWVKQSIVDALGPEQVTVEQLFYDIDIPTQVFSQATIGGAPP